MRFILFFILGLLAACSSCEQNQESNEAGKNKDYLKDVLERGELRAITTYSGTTYFLYRGEPMGFEYELLQQFTDELGVDLTMVIAEDENELIPMLKKGEGDLIAYGYTILEERKKHINFSEPLYFSSQVLVQRKPQNWRRMRRHQINQQIITNPVQLIGDTISVKINSAYASRIKNLNEEIGGKIYIDTIPGNMTTGKIIRKVAEGKLKYTVADQNIAQIYASAYPELNIDTKISLTQRIAWGLPKYSNELKDTLNDWIKSQKNTLDYNMVYNRYFKNTRLHKRRVKSSFYSLNEGKISQYDNLIKKYADKHNWDWRLLASIIYQESKFKPTSESWVGAQGLMQIMPATAKDLGITDTTDPQQSVRGGTAYLDQIYDKFDNVEDSIQRLKFTLASYNSGLGHVRDAQRLADYNELDRYQWDENVEKMILELSKPKNYNRDFIRYGYVRGREPFNYVRQIFSRYEHYKRFIDQKGEAKETQVASAD
ncbi:MAG: transporter substrate-binding domain-containing protein [Psychroflexus sp.]|jgi:membrane-bound lytic murein transglycosylase F|nr:transporter substrate-binding domain-containing protein [Psychroflexus sp.]